MMSIRRAGAAVCLALSARAAEAQWRSPTDRSLGASLLAAALPGPSTPVWTAEDSARVTSAVRFDVHYGAPLTRDAFGTSPMMVIGIRDEHQQRDSTTGLAGVMIGARLGVRTGDAVQRRPLGAVETYLGFRTLAYVDNPAHPDVGADLVLGWGGFGDNTRASFGLRFPVEMVFEGTSARLALLATPAVGWGHLRLRSCEDTGPDDNCGDLGLQVAAGQPRYLIGGGASLTLMPARLSVSAGVQRLFAPGERSRGWAGLGWTP
ncbi:MAG TPA: hypothetical protein VHM30_01155 [Gemmatimonadaceae bacterium]|nr:hypothetical protein [Gemmatimonadaceae bacterium]